MDRARKGNDDIYHKKNAFQILLWLTNIII